MLVMSRVIFVMIIYPAYLVLTSAQATPVVIVTINMLLNFVFSIGLGAMYAFLPERSRNRCVRAAWPSSTPWG